MRGAWAKAALVLAAAYAPSPFVAPLSAAPYVVAGPQRPPTTATRASIIPPTTCQGPKVYEDDFQTYDSGAWGPVDARAGIAATPDKSVSALGVSAQGAVHALLNVRSLQPTVDVCVVTFADPANRPDDEGGLLFWAASPSDYYFLAVTNDGRFAIWRRQADDWTPIVGLQASPALHGEINEVEVSLAWAHATIFFNGRQAATFDADPKPGGSRVGLVVKPGTSAPSAYRFARLTITQPAQPAGQAAAATATGPCSGSLILADDFHTMNSAWGAPDQFASVANGALTLTAPAGGTMVRVNGKSRYGDFDACVALGAKLAGVAAGSAGLVFWVQDPQNFYVFAIVDAGAFSVFRYASGDVSQLVAWTPTPTLRTGAGAVNQLEVRAVGDSATMAINGQQVTSIRGSPPAGGGLIALIAAAGASGPAPWSFSRFRVARPASAALDGSQ